MEPGAGPLRGRQNPPGKTGLSQFTLNTARGRGHISETIVNTKKLSPKYLPKKRRRTFRRKYRLFWQAQRSGPRLLGTCLHL